MRFVWFWTFWHWSIESFRGGALLLSPLHGIGSHWDEWFNHEASSAEREAIQEAGRTKASQRQFIAWLLRHWGRDAGLRKNGLARHFVLGQLAQVEPFDQWAAFEEYGQGCGLGGISAIVLTEKSLGEGADVRVVEAVALPAAAGAPAIVTEGFQADSVDLEMPRRAAMSALSGKGLALFLARWIAGGRRPYPAWLKAALTMGWLVLGGIILWLVAGPEPGDKLVPLSVALAGLWFALLMPALAVMARECFLAWRQGQVWRARLEESQVRLRMSGGLTVKGGSAGLVFTLSALLSVFRAHRGEAGNSWLWREFFSRLRSDGATWAATGLMTGDGSLKAVMLESKLRACLKQNEIKHVLVPRQPGASECVLSRSNPAMAPVEEKGQTRLQLGFAAEEKPLHVHPCRNIAQAMMRVGGFTSAGQMALNLFACVASCAMLFGLPDLAGILAPPPVPVVVKPGSPSPNYLWVSLNTKRPGCFGVVLESEVWSNRRADVMTHKGVDGSTRAEIRLHRLDEAIGDDPENGTVWIERRYHFLGREFAPGERVGRYSFSYINALGYD